MEGGGSIRRDPLTFGDLLRRSRGHQDLSQLELSLRARVSTRHLSFLETGRARPSEGMIARLAATLRLPLAVENELWTSAGFAIRGNARTSRGLDPHLTVDPGLPDSVFETALGFEQAQTPAALIAHARPLLHTFGVEHFHCGTLRHSLDGSISVSRETEGAFPQRWLDRYGERGYASSDPLLREAGKSHSCFFWADLPMRTSLNRREQRIIDEAGEFGITAGFVVPVRRADGTIRAVSMMGDRIDHRDPCVRLGLQTLGICLLDRLDRIKSDLPNVDLSGLAGDGA